MNKKLDKRIRYSLLTIWIILTLKKEERSQRALDRIILDDMEKHFGTLRDMHRIDMFVGDVIGFASCK